MTRKGIRKIGKMAREDPKRVRKEAEMTRKGIRKIGKMAREDPERVKEGGKAIPGELISSKTSPMNDAVMEPLKVDR